MEPEAGRGEVEAVPEHLGASPTSPLRTWRVTVVGGPVCPLPVMEKIPSAAMALERRERMVVVVVNFIFDR